MIAVLSLVMALGACGGSGDHSAQIASSIGASSCSKTRFYILFRTDNTKAPIYDCFVGAKELCVTDEGGIATDETALARALFANALGSDSRPACAA